VFTFPLFIFLPAYEVSSCIPDSSKVLLQKIVALTVFGSSVSLNFGVSLFDATNCFTSKYSGVYISYKFSSGFVKQPIHTFAHVCIILLWP